MAEAAEARDVAAADQAGWSLPAWVYREEDFLALERERVFMPSWQIVCHLSEIPNAGDYVTFELLGELALVVRGADDRARAFHNVCRHRASRLLDGPKGNCGRRILCPYHAWGYELDGRLAQVPHEETFEGLERTEHGLAPVELEIFLGFVFIRFEGGGPSVAEMMAPVADELGLYHIDEMEPLGRATLRPRAVNWKNVGDNYSDSLHIPVAHGGLTRLFGNSYTIEAVGGVHRLSGRLRDKPSTNWSERAYQAWLPVVEHLPPERRRLWFYVKFFPNFAFDIYPDQIDFMQWIPLSASETLVREIPYGIIALSLCYGAYMAEIFRAGIQSIPVGQHEAARALGLRPGITMRKIIMPQAMRLIVPPTGNQFIAMLKDSSLVSVMGVWELMYLARSHGRAEFRYIEMLITAAIIYWIISIVFELIQARIEVYYGKGVAG